MFRLDPLGTRTTIRSVIVVPTTSTNLQSHCLLPVESIVQSDDIRIHSRSHFLVVSRGQSALCALIPAIRISCASYKSCSTTQPLGHLPPTSLGHLPPTSLYAPGCSRTTFEVQLACVAARRLESIIRGYLVTIHTRRRRRHCLPSTLTSPPRLLRSTTCLNYPSGLSPHSL